MRKIFISTTHQLVVEDEDFMEYLKTAKDKNLITVDPTSIQLTEEGKQLVEIGYLQTAQITHYLEKLLSEKAVLILTAICLIILSSLKIFIGYQLSSQAMISEGFENLSDFIKIVIIFAIGIKLGKDKTASILIIFLMLFTGGTMIWSSINALLDLSPINPTVQAFLISFLSIVFNYGLMYVKGLVGRISGNLSLLSDSKDSQLNVMISIGVIIGLIFSILKYYFVDSIVGLIIAIIIFKEGIEFLWELRKTAKEDFDISDIKVYGDNLYQNRLTGYILASIRRENITRAHLLDNFKKGLSIGRIYYQGFADFFYKELGPKIAEKHLDRLIEDKYIKEDHGELLLNLKGLKAFYEAKAKEYESRAKDISYRRKPRKGAIICLVILILLILVILFAEDINLWFQSF
ncbi:MAG: conserved membrane protein of unknown function [Promethearchaeota archaeon]|nr:MAG: conserved membrane protein of unknown function [Candidatus Lokiarchaeota archaeon]